MNRIKLGKIIMIVGFFFTIPMTVLISGLTYYFITSVPINEYPIPLNVLSALGNIFFVLGIILIIFGYFYKK